MNLILLIVLGSLVMGGMAYHAFGRRETIEDWVARERELGEPRVIATFQRRRRWGVRVATLLLGLALAAFAAPGVTRVPREGAVFAGFTLVILTPGPPAHPRGRVGVG